MSQPTPNQPARAQRSVLGMVGAMLVLLAVVGVFVVARSALRNELEVRPSPVDYLAAVDAAQENGIRVFYPAEIPDDWVVTSVKLPQAAGQPWGLGMLTEDGQFVGVRQESTPPEALAQDRLGDDASVTSPATVGGDELTDWRTVVAGDGADGDTGVVSVVDEESVMVYGSADASAISQIAASLTSQDR